jgi:hypothetical protein
MKLFGNHQFSFSQILLSFYFDEVNAASTFAKSISFLNGDKEFFSEDEKNFLTQGIHDINRNFSRGKKIKPFHSKISEEGFGINRNISIINLVNS